MSADATLFSTDQPPLARTPLFDMHVDAGARMVGFAGYEMPVQYGHGVLFEHNHTRAHAGLFDVSHMGQARLSPIKDDGDAASLMEKLVPGGISTLGEGRIRYTLLTQAAGGIRDDLMVTRFGETVWLVVNAACKTHDFAYIAEALDGHALLEVQDRALLALQGPQAALVLARLIEAVDELAFMQATWAEWRGHAVWCRAAAILARTVLKFHCRRKLPPILPPPCWAMKRSRLLVWARAIACGLKRACAFTDMIST